MDLLDELFGSEFNPSLYDVLCEDEKQAAQMLWELEQPLEGDEAHCCLRRGLECSPELFQQLLEHCKPGVYGERYILQAKGVENSYILGEGSMLQLAAMMDRPRHVRLLLEHGYDCNSAGLELADYLLRECRSGAVPRYGVCCGVQSNTLTVCEQLECQQILCATPLAAALLCGSLGAAEELLRWPGVWKGESSAVCRAAVMVLEGMTRNLVSEKRRRAQMEILRQIFCPERKTIPDRDTLLRTCYLRPSSFADLCSIRTLRCQLESGLCGKEDAEQLLELLNQRNAWERGWNNRWKGRWREDGKSNKVDRTLGGKLLLLKQFFPEVCRQPWATGVFLREILWRLSENRPYKTLMKAWKQLCGKERDLTWLNGYFLRLAYRDQRRFLEEAGADGTLVMDEDAVGGLGSRSMMELLKRVRFCHRSEAGTSGLMQCLLGMGNVRVLQYAAKRGVLTREDPAVLMEHLTRNPGMNQGARSLVLTYARKQGTQGDSRVENWQDPRRWECWCSWAREEDDCPEELHALLHEELPREDCLWAMFRLQKYLDMVFFRDKISVDHSRYPSLKVHSLTGVACCAERGQAMQLLLEDMPGRLRETVRAFWDQNLSFVGTPLCLSAALGRTEQVRLLLESGVHPDEVGRGSTSQFVARKTNFEVEALAVTPLLAAILFGEEETARLLLAYGAVCDFSRPAYRRILYQGSAASLALAERLPGVGFEKIPEEEVEALRISTGEKGFWTHLEEESCLDAWLM